jgi:hypothetical protein
MLQVLRLSAMNRDEEGQAVKRARGLLEDFRQFGEDRFLPGRVRPRG